MYVNPSNTGSYFRISFSIEFISDCNGERIMLNSVDVWQNKSDDSFYGLQGKSMYTSALR